MLADSLPEDLAKAGRLLNDLQVMWAPNQQFLVMQFNRSPVLGKES